MPRATWRAQVNPERPRGADSKFGRKGSTGHAIVETGWLHVVLYGGLIQEENIRISR